MADVTDKSKVLSSKAIVTDKTALFRNNAKVLNKGALHNKGEKNAPQNTKFKIRLYDLDSDKFVDENGAVYITSEPRMPNLIVLIDVPKGWSAPIYIELKVKYSHHFKNTQHDITRTTSLNAEGNKVEKPENMVLKIPTGEQYRFGFKFDKIRGGNATITATDKRTNTLATFKFIIKGKNPTKEQVNSYIEQKEYDTTYWFFKAIIETEAPSYSQFDTNGMPLFGKPDGWGIAQRDQYKKKNIPNEDLDYIWDWKKNIDTELIVLNEKVDTTKRILNNELTADKDAAINAFKNNPSNFQEHEDINYGDVTFSHVKTTIPTLKGLNKYFDDNPNGKKSFLDANVIRLYNGGMFYTLEKVSDGKYKWIVDDTNAKGRNYVKDVCEKV